VTPETSKIRDLERVHRREIAALERAHRRELGLIGLLILFIYVGWVGPPVPGWPLWIAAGALLTWGLWSVRIRLLRRHRED